MDSNAPHAYSEEEVAAVKNLLRRRGDDRRTGMDVLKTRFHATGKDDIIAATDAAVRAALSMLGYRNLTEENDSVGIAEDLITAYEGSLERRYTTPKGPSRSR